MKYAIVVSRFNQGVTQKLLEGSIRTFRNHKIGEDSLKIVWAPGAFELPLLALALAESRKYRAVVCLGCVIKGETSHNEHIARSAAQGILDASLLTGVPIAFGVLTPDNRRQALARSGNGSSNKGSEAAEAAIEMAETLARLKKSPRRAKKTRHPAPLSIA